MQVKRLSLFHVLEIQLPLPWRYIRRISTIIMIKLEYKSNQFQVIPGDIITCSSKKQQIQILCDLVYSKNTEDMFYDMLPKFIEDACCFIEKYLLDRFRVKVRVVYCGNHTSTAYGDRINGYHLQSVEFESSLLVL